MGDFMNFKRNVVIRILLTLLVTFIIYYFMLPPLNFTSPVFWTFAFIVFAVYMILGIPFTFRNHIVISKTNFPKQLVFIPGAIICALFLINFVLSPLFISSKYASRITINKDGVFSEDINEVNFNSLPLLDKDSSQKLGDRVMGQMPELVSQFYVSDLYTQINYNNEIIRVTPLEYSDLFKFFSNSKDGVKGYITVNSVSGESKLVKLEKGMKYMPSAYFFKNLYRYIRIKYPTEIFDQENFEIDNEGNPYWVIPTVKYNGIGIRKEITGVIIVNPITGETNKYKVGDVPSWIDHVYPSDLIIEQLDDWGLYSNGFFNSIFSQKNVTMTTTGYNYTVMNDDVYLYTGITSVSNDEANIGFVLSNLRTKETVYYEVPGAEEYSAMASAEGQVQQMNYTATFPLLINLNGRATYLISLKDNAGLVKMYAFVDVVDYQKVVVTDSSKGIEVAAKNYLSSADFKTNSDSLITEDIVISSITSATIDGTTYYYITSTDNRKFRLSVKLDELRVPFLNSGNTINISYNSNKDVIEVLKLN